MSTFKLQIVAPNRLFYEGEVNRIVARTQTGDVGILPNHVKYIAPLAIGELRIYIGDEIRYAAVSGGFIKVGKDKTVICANACEWAEEIDVDRAELAKSRAEQTIAGNDTVSTELIHANIKLKRAVNRLHVAERDS